MPARPAALGTTPPVTITASVPFATAAATDVCIVGVPADDLDDVHPRCFSRAIAPVCSLYGGAVTTGIGQRGDLADHAGAAPALMESTPGVENSGRIQRRLDRAQQCHAQITHLRASRAVVGTNRMVVRDRSSVAMIASNLFLAAGHCSIGSPRCPATTVKYSDARRWDARATRGITSRCTPMRPAVVSASVTAAFGCWTTPWRSRGSRESLRGNRSPQIRAGPTAIPRPPPVLRPTVPPRAASNARVSACLLGVFLGALRTGDPQTAAGDLGFPIASVVAS